MFQFGSQHVTYMDGAPKRTIANDTAQIAMTLTQKHKPAGACDAAIKKCNVAAPEWLKEKAQTMPLDTRPPTRITGQTNQLQVVATVPNNNWDAVMRASGADGVFVRPFYDANVSIDGYNTSHCRTTQPSNQHSGKQLSWVRWHMAS